MLAQDGLRGFVRGGGGGWVGSGGGIGSVYIGDLREDANRGMIYRGTFAGGNIFDA